MIWIYRCRQITDLAHTKINVSFIQIDEKSAVVSTKDDSSTKATAKTNEVEIYRNLLSYMKRNETISQTLHRLGKSRPKMSTIERIKMKKRGEVDNDAKRITMFTELADSLLTTTGNMDVYQLTYEYLQSKVDKCSSTSSSSDMYSDDFIEVELKTLNKQPTMSSQKPNLDVNASKLLWEFKWTQQDTSVDGPYNTEQMMDFSKTGHFKSGVYVRKVGEDTNFYSSNRIDFDLYL